MREFAKISPQFWINERGRKIKKLGIETQLIALYLLTNPHVSMIGIYYLPFAFIEHETGLSPERTTKGLQGLIDVGFCSYDTESEYIWVHDLVFDQVGGQLKEQDNRVKAINEAYLGLPHLPFLNAFYEKYAEAFFLENRVIPQDVLEAPLEPLRSKEKNKDKDNNKEKKKEKEITMSTKHDIACSPETSFLNNEKQDIKSQAVEILNFLIKKTDRTYLPENTNLKLIMARLKNGATLEECKKVIARKTRDWKGVKKMDQWLRPATLFEKHKFEQYRGELVVSEESNNG